MRACPGRLKVLKLKDLVVFFVVSTCLTFTTAFNYTQKKIKENFLLFFLPIGQSNSKITLPLYVCFFVFAHFRERR